MNNFKRFLVVLLVFLLLIPVFNNKYKSDEVVSELNIENHNRVVETVTTDSTLDKLKNNCKSYYLLDPTTNIVIAKHNENDRHQIASMTKIMTAIIVFDKIKEGNISYDTMVNISKNASNVEGSKILLDCNSSHSVDNLLKSLIVASANDSAIALAEHISGSEEGFVTLMNDRANILKLENTKFCNVTGLPSDNQYSCSKDVAIMLNELMKNEKYFKYCSIWLEDYVHPSGRKTTMTNTNKLIKHYNGCDAGKTGYTSCAKHCLCASAKRNNTRFISCVIGAESSKERFFIASELLNYGFNNYTNKVIFNKNQKVATVNIKGAKNNNIDVFAKEDITVFSKNNTKIDYDIEIIQEQIKAPISSGTVVAKAVVTSNNKKCEYDLVITEDVLEKDYLDSLNDIFINW